MAVLLLLLFSFCLQVVDVGGVPIIISLLEATIKNNSSSDNNDKNNNNGNSTPQGLQLQIALIDAIGEISNAPDAMEQFFDSAVPFILQLLCCENPLLQQHGVGALGNIALHVRGRQVIREKEGLTHVVNLLRGVSPPLLVNACRLLANCAKEKECAQVIVEGDGLRLLWSLLQSTSNDVITAGANAISVLLKDEKNAYIPNAGIFALIKVYFLFLNLYFCFILLPFLSFFSF
jgi:hypothetical protein